MAGTPIAVTNEEIVGVVYNADGSKKSSYREAAAILNISPSTLQSRLKAMKREAKGHVRYTDYLPPAVEPVHLKDPVHLMLRTLAEVEAGEELGANTHRAMALFFFEELLKDKIVVYRPSTGYELVRRDKGEEGSLRR
ncbi:hypothetical protein [Streptomyces sp. NPDC050507]|uniref:hypothetical protein n=1 Tax=Streptomyces sp. NPDC050507 TaxID=3365619 RepID=UPI00379B98F3